MEYMISTLTGIGVGLFFALLLRTAYQLMSNRWPEGYDYSTRMIERAPRLGVISYVLFRLVPTYVVAALAIVTASRMGGGVVITAVVLTTTYVVTGDLRAAVDTIRRNDPRRHILVVLYAINISLVLGAVFMAAISRKVVSRFIPRPMELLTSVWTAAFVAVFVYFIERVFRRKDLKGPTLDAILSRLGRRLESYIRLESVKRNCSPELILAVVLTEVEQRPAWFRRGERLYGWITKRKGISYGVGQIRSDTPLDDRQSVDGLCEEFAGFYPGGDRFGDSFELRLRLAQHNRDAVFVTTAFRRYYELIPEVTTMSSELAYDNRYTAEVYRPQYHGTRMTISGSVSGDGEVHSLQLRTGISPYGKEIGDILVPARNHRVAFERDLPVQFGMIYVLCDGEVVGDGFSLDKCSALPW